MSLSRDWRSKRWRGLREEEEEEDEEPVHVPCMCRHKGKGGLQRKKAGRIGGTREGRRREGGAMWKAKMKMECPPKPLL